MIVKQRRFELSSGTLFGIGGGAFLLLTAALMITSSLTEQTVPGCSERYENAGIFALNRSSGELLDSISLQSKLGGSDWGLLDNVQIVPGETEAMRAAMRVNFEPGGKFDANNRTAASGFGFDWRPPFLGGAKSACLSYSVWLPEDFDFADGGTLPGLFGGPAVARTDQAGKFSVRMRWLANRKFAAFPVTAQSQRGKTLVFDEDWFKLPRGAWVSIEQEIVLNDAGQANGELRVWVDGKMGLERHGIRYRDQGDAGLQGVIADTHYTGKDMIWQAAPKATTVKLSPMVLRWK